MVIFKCFDLIRIFEKEKKERKNKITLN